VQKNNAMLQREHGRREMREVHSKFAPLLYLKLRLGEMHARISFRKLPMKEIGY
jgi:hypothetical protein